MCHEMEKIYSEGMESAKAVNHDVNEVQKWIDENLCAIK